MPLIIESVRESQDGREMRYSGEFRYAEVLADTDPCERLETDLLMQGFTIPGLAYAIASKSERAVHAAFSCAGMRLENMEVEIDLSARCHILKIEFTVFRALRTPANPKVSVRADEAMRSLGNAAQGAAASTEQSAIGRIATSNNSENYRAFVEQLHREMLQGMGIPERMVPERMAGGRLYGRPDTPAITPSPAPKQKAVSPFSIGLGQRSIEV